MFKKIIKSLLGKSESPKKIPNNPYLAILIDAQDSDLIADEQFRIGSAYLEGAYMLPKDLDKALSYFKKAAERGHAVAQINMMRGCMKECDDNNNEVLYWLQKAAEQGLPQALYNLAISYHRGDIDGKVDIVKSNELLRKAAELGYIAAFSRLAMVYRNGEGVEKNQKIAMHWAWLDFINLPEEAKANSLFVHLVEPEDFEGNAINGEQIIINAAEAGEPDAMNSWAAALLDNGEKDKAIDLWKKAAELNHPQAICNLAYMYMEGETKDYEHAKVLLERASKFGYERAFYQLARLYYEGLGVEKNMAKAWEYLEKSINKGHAASRYLLANMCINNELQEVLPDKVMRGMSYMELAAKDRYKPALDFYYCRPVKLKRA